MFRIGIGARHQPAPAQTNANLEQYSWPLRVMIVGPTGCGKSSLINALIGRKVADASDRQSGGTKESLVYTADIDHGGASRRIIFTDNPGLGDPTVSFEEAMTALVVSGGTGPESSTSMCAATFDLVLVCDKEENRCTQAVRQAMQVIDVLTSRSGVAPWPNVMLVGTQADKWNDVDVDGNEVDPIAKFYNEHMPEVARFAVQDGAASCKLTQGCCVTSMTKSRKATDDIKVSNLLDKLMRWPSHLDSSGSYGVQFRPFHMEDLRIRYANISQMTVPPISPAFQEMMNKAMARQDLVAAFDDLSRQANAWRQQSNLPSVLNDQALKLDQLVLDGDNVKSRVVKTKGATAALGTAAAVMVWFPPTTVFGVICGVASGAGSLASTYDDSSNGNAREMSLKDAMVKCAELTAEFDNSTKNLARAVERCNDSLLNAAEHGTDNEELDRRLQAAFGTAKLVGHGVGAVQFVVMGGSAARVSCTAFGGVLAGVGAVVAIADLIFTADAEAPNRTKLTKAAKSLREESKRIETTIKAMEEHVCKTQQDVSQATIALQAATARAVHGGA